VAPTAFGSKNQGVERLRLSRRGFLAVTALLGVAREVRAEGATSSRLRSVLEVEFEALGRWAKSVGGRFGASFVDVASGAEIASSFADAPMNPASNQKLVTAGVALRHLGPRYTFSAGLYGQIRAGRVDELVLRAAGDPSLTHGDLEAFAKTLAEKGVRGVGDVLVDQSAFDEHFVPPGFEQQPDEWAPFRAPVSAVALDRNSVLVSIVPAERGAPAKVLFEPQGFVDVAGQIKTTPRGASPLARVGLAANGARLVAKVSGSVPEGSEPIRYRQRVDDPRLLAGYALKNALAAAGIAVSGTVRSGGSAQKGELVSRKSRPLAELLPELGKQSDNFYAETLLKTVALEARGRPASSAAGAEVATAWLKEIGAWEAEVHVGNGSGLFDANRLTARSLARLLVSVQKSPDLAASFLAQLAVGGVDGTLRGRFTKLAQRRAVVAKTGTLRDVVALSGYVMDPDRTHPVAFSLLLNGIAGRAPAGRQRIDRIVELVANELNPSAEPAGRASRSPALTSERAQAQAAQ
jgi:D-alanyl-D-alanine carboxypeptidase/D-alanyl-D-alanine-endopeptidase (penicillin-binding protein 4)